MSSLALPTFSSDDYNDFLGERKPFIARHVILKVASRCTLFCDYCYWFRDESVYSQPKLMSEEVEDFFLTRLENYILETELEEITLVFHGGEPLLLPKSRYLKFATKVRAIEQRSGKSVVLGITTNGTIIDAEWVTLFQDLNISPCISIDGSPSMHNKHRVYKNGCGSHTEVVRGLNLLCEAGLSPSVLAVCDPENSPDELCAYFVDELGVKQFDVLMPDFTIDDSSKGLVKPIADFYNRLFDIWYEDYSRRGVQIRILKSFIQAILSGSSRILGLGLNTPLATVVIQTDGSIQPHDVLGIGGNHLVRTSCNVRTHELTSITTDPVWLAAFRASQQPAQKCLECNYLYACGGGDVMGRYSSDRGYDNPTVYCNDMMRIIDHIWNRIAPDVYIENT